MDSVETMIPLDACAPGGLVDKMRAGVAQRQAENRLLARRTWRKKEDLPPLPANVPTFRSCVLEAAEYGILQVSENGRWLDLLVKRGEDLVYICTWPNA